MTTPSTTAGEMIKEIRADQCAVGDGFIFDGKKFLRIGPCIKTNTVIVISNQLEGTQAALRQARDALCEVTKEVHPNFVLKQIVNKALASISALEGGEK